jgi:hypothetical protein
MRHAPCSLLAGARTRPALTSARMLQHCFSSHQVVWQVLSPPRLLLRSPPHIPLVSLRRPLATRWCARKLAVSRQRSEVGAAQAGGRRQAAGGRHGGDASRRQAAGMAVMAVEANREWMVCRSESAQSRPSPSRTRPSRSRLPRSACARASRSWSASSLRLLLAVGSSDAGEGGLRTRMRNLIMGGGRADTDQGGQDSSAGSSHGVRRRPLCRIPRW